MIPSKLASLRNCRLHRKIYLNVCGAGPSSYFDFALFKGVPGSYNNAGRIEFTMLCLPLRELGPPRRAGFLVRSPYAAARPQIIGLSDRSHSISM